MPITQGLIHLLGAVALLLWGVHMVRSGVERAFGQELRRFLAGSLRGRFRACLAGLGVSVALQGSTATALVATSFQAEGVIGLATGLAVMLGANVGTAVVARVLSFDLSLAYPVLILAGLVAFRSASRGRPRQIGRAAIGLGLMLLALHLLLGVVTPTSWSPETLAAVAAATREPLPTLILAALVTWAAHSSVAVVLLVASLAASGLVGTEAALAMVLGANLGSALNPLVAALGDRRALRLPVGNLVNRLAGCMIALPLLPELALAMGRLDGGGPGRLVADFHLLFNLALAALFFLPLPLVARLVERLLPEPAPGGDPGTASYLQPASLRAPAVALSDAAREVLRMADVVEAMLRGSRELLRGREQDQVAELRRADDELDRRHGALKRFLGELDREALAEPHRRRLAQILVTALNLEHAGDILDNGLLHLAAKRIRRAQGFSAEELAELDAMHGHLLGQLRLAVSVFMSDDLGTAFRLVEEKERFRELERAATERYFGRLGAGDDRAGAAGSVHLDMIRDLKRVEAHLAAIAHPLLERSHLLRQSRLVRAVPPADAGDHGPPLVTSARP
ncbi:MAG TPA: Na/Pi cotransporter family protein [Geminicoccaceae bacterium]|nr:Na/Pi cotransporter family protein [Geminicoccaceae bacterium]